MVWFSNLHYPLKTISKEFYEFVWATKVCWAPKTYLIYWKVICVIALYVMYETLQLLLHREGYNLC